MMGGGGGICIACIKVRGINRKCKSIVKLQLTE